MAVCWLPRQLRDADVALLESTRDLEVQQQTPVRVGGRVQHVSVGARLASPPCGPIEIPPSSVRPSLQVLHRRANLARPRFVREMRVQRLPDVPATLGAYFALHLLAPSLALPLPS